MTAIGFNNTEIMCTGSSTESCDVKISGIKETALFSNSNYIVFYNTGKPSVPLDTSVTAIGSNTVVISWSPPLHSSECINHYVVNVINGISKNTSNNSTTLVINELIQGINYSFSVTGIDRAERTGEESETARITLDGKVNSLRLLSI